MKNFRWNGKMIKLDQIKNAQINIMLCELRINKALIKNVEE